MEVPNQLRLTRCASLEIEIASIVALSREDAKYRIDAVWWKELANPIRDPMDEPDRDWEWREIVSAHQNKPFFRAVSVRTNDRACQAAMLYRVDAKSALHEGQGAVFIDRLATAPMNREGLTENPRYRGSGTGLLTYAVALSYSLGFSGRAT
jgi:hypothetical protein